MKILVVDDEDVGGVELAEEAEPRQVLGLVDGADHGGACLIVRAKRRSGSMPTRPHHYRARAPSRAIVFRTQTVLDATERVPPGRGDERERRHSRCP